jgi:WD40 repeat protein
MAYTFMSHIYLFHLFTGHSNVVTSVCFSRDGTRIVSGSYDKTVRIWNAVTGACEVTMEGM